MRKPRHPRESRDHPKIVATRIGMKKTDHRARYGNSGSCMIVEGVTDLKVHSKFVDGSACFLEFACGKESAINAHREVRRRNIPGVFTVVDSDYDHLRGCLPHGSDIFITDSHDLETMILRSSALENLLAELMPASKMMYRNELAKEVRSKLINIGLSLGCLRYICLEEGISWNKNLDYSRLIDKKDLRLDVSALLEDVSRARNAPDRTALLKRIKLLREEVKNPWLMCNGHDLVNILVVILPLMLRTYSNNPPKLNVTRISELLRSAYELRFFENTDLYGQIRQWESTNSPFRVY